MPLILHPMLSPFSDLPYLATRPRRGLPLVLGAIWLVAAQAAAAQPPLAAPPETLLAELATTEGRDKADRIRDLVAALPPAEESAADSPLAPESAPQAELVARTADALVQALDDRATVVRRAAIRGLGRLPLEVDDAGRAADALAPRLPTASDRDGELLIEALANLETTVAITALLKEIGGPRDEAARRALARVGAGAEDAFRTALDDDRVDVRLVAARRLVALVRDDDHASQVVRAVILGDDPKLRDRALCIRAGLESSAAEAERLFAMGPEVATEARPCIVRRLARVGEPAMASALAALEDPEDPMHSLAPAILLGIRPLTDATRRRIEARRNDPDPTVRREALNLYAASERTTEEVLPELLAALDDPKGSIRMLAVGHLAARRAGGDEVVDRLARLLEHDPERGVRDQARVTLVQLGELAPPQRPGDASGRGTLQSWLIPAIVTGVVTLVAILGFRRRARSGRGELD